MKIWGIHRKYKSLPWWEEFMGGHITLWNVTIFGSNAMFWTVQISTKKWGYICFTLPTLSKHRRKRGYYFYISPNATPDSSTFYRSNKDMRNQKIKAKIRKYYFGHNFDSFTEDESDRQLLNEIRDNYKKFIPVLERHEKLTNLL